MNICINCGKSFVDEDDIGACEVCGWEICPHCGGCLCAIPLAAKGPVIAMWLTDNWEIIPETVRDGWMRFMKLLIRSRPQS